MSSDEIQGVLSFWFGDRLDATEGATSRDKLWWSGAHAADAEVGARFGGLHSRAADGTCDSWVQTASGRLALILVLDQFSRMLHRGTVLSFAFDAKAVRHCLDGLEHGNDRLLRPIERVFFYLPLEHSESLEHQKRCVELFETLAAEVPPAQRVLFDDYTQFARQHRDIVALFGRFPHRNLVLGRTSTAEELEFLKKPGSSF